MTSSDESVLAQVIAALLRRSGSVLKAVGRAEPEDEDDGDDDNDDDDDDDETVVAVAVAADGVVW